MNSKTVRKADVEGGHVCIPVPLPDQGVFSHTATAAVLQVLRDNPETSFTNRELHRLTGKGLGNVNGAVTDLESLGLVAVDRTGRGNSVTIDETKVINPEDPLTLIPQREFREPTRATLAGIRERIGTDPGIMLFGSVARGTADRLSDVDLFVVVEEGRMTAQRTAHEIEDEIASVRFNGDRYEPHIVVETRDSAVDHDRIRDVLTDGLTLRESPVLDAVKAEVFSSGT